MAARSLESVPRPHPRRGRRAVRLARVQPLGAGRARECDRRRLASDGQSAFDGKPGAVVSVSPGAIGGFGANHHLRQMMVFLNVPMLHQPEAYVGNAAKLFDSTGALAIDDTRRFMTRFLEAFADWIERNGARQNDRAAAE